LAEPYTDLRKDNLESGMMKQLDIDEFTPLCSPPPKQVNNTKKLFSRRRITSERKQ